MVMDDSSKQSRVEVAINVLNQALQKLQDHDYMGAQVMVALARQVLEDLQLDFELHFQAKAAFEQLLKQKFP
jgi:hypothetical protein